MKYCKIYSKFPIKIFFLSYQNRFLPGFAPFVDGTVIVNPANTPIDPLTLPTGSAIARYASSL